MLISTGAAVFHMIALVTLQQPAVRVIPDSPSCARCRVVVNHVATVGDEDRGIVGQQFTAVRDDSGRVFVSHPAKGDELLVFDSAGRYLRTIGRLGSGPNEYRFIRTLALGPDGVHVLDSRNLRGTVLSPGLELLRTYPLPGDPQNAVVLNNGEVVVSTAIPSREKVGFTLHLLDRRGRVRRSFDEMPGDVVFDPGLPGRRALGLSAEPEAFWAASATEYVIRKWSTDGRLVAEFRRTPEWFEPHTSEIWPHPDTPPAPQMRALDQDSTGLLWVFMARPDDQWFEAVEPDSTWIGGFRWTDNWTPFYDTVIDVIDPARGMLVATFRFDTYYQQYLGSGYVASYRESPQGTPLIDVWRVRLVR
jgi:hypothetical protein